jgi:colanic acid biosynthesis glycosyl transferase WcaI
VKILFLTDNFPPERNAPANRTYEHAVEWVRSGHDVTVVTTAPNFPSGTVFPGYKNRLYDCHVLDGIKVIRVLSYISPNRGFLRRVLDYASFGMAGCIAALLLSRPDVLITTSPQFFCAVGGWLASRIRRMPWIFELRDLWPASIRALGAVKQPLGLRLLEWLELRMYRDANAVVAVSPAFKRDLEKRGIDPEKVHVVMNGVNLTKFSPMAKDPQMLRDHGLEGKFIVGYLGTHGRSHALEYVIEAAKLLKDDPTIAFLFAGEGENRDKIVELAHSEKLGNVHFLPPQRHEEMPRLWSIHDVALIPLANVEVFRTVIPSKMFEAMAMGVPILMSVPQGEATALLNDSGSGLTIAPESAVMLADAIRRLAGSPSQCAALAEAGPRYAERFTRSAQAKAMLQLIARIVEPQSLAILPVYQLSAHIGQDRNESLMARTGSKVEKDSSN